MMEGLPLTQKDMAPIQPVSKDLLYMKVADAIHAYIQENRLEAGDKIPSERVLAQQLQTGRNSVREALRVLEHEGLIEVKTGRGAFVASNEHSGPIYLKLFKGNFFELLEIKTVLEREAICRAANTANSLQLEGLDLLLAPVEEAAERGVYRDDLDRDFHLELLKLGRNKTLADTVANLIDALASYANLLDHADEIFLQTIPYHRTMLEAIKSRDVVKAVEMHQKILEVDVTALNMAVDDFHG